MRCATSHFQIQIEEVSQGEGQKDAGGQPEGEGGPKGRAQQHKDVGDLDRKGRAVDARHCRESRHIAQRKELVGQAEDLEDDDEQFDGGDAAEARAQRVAAFRGARRVPGLGEGLAGAFGLAVNSLRHDCWRWGQRREGKTGTTRRGLVRRGRRLAALAALVGVISISSIVSGETRALATDR